MTVCDNSGPDSGYPFNDCVPLSRAYFRWHQTTPPLVKWKYIGLEQLQNRMVPDEKGGEPKEVECPQKQWHSLLLSLTSKAPRELKTWRHSVLLSRTSTCIELTKQNAHICILSASTGTR